MRLELRPFSDAPDGPVLAIRVEIGRPDPVTLSLHYILEGEIARLAVPAPGAPERTDELWRHTCFEAFLHPEPGEAYAEFNFAPSAQWAAYRFTDYREGMSPAPIAAPRLQLTQTADTLELTVRLNLAGLNLPPGACRLALCAVIEETS